MSAADIACPAAVGALVSVVVAVAVPAVVDAALRVARAVGDATDGAVVATVVAVALLVVALPAVGAVVAALVADAVVDAVVGAAVPTGVALVLLEPNEQAVKRNAASIGAQMSAERARNRRTIRICSSRGKPAPVCIISAHCMPKGTSPPTPSPSQPCPSSFRSAEAMERGFIERLVAVSYRYPIRMNSPSPSPSGFGHSGVRAAMERGQGVRTVMTAR
jgi:hypothetical protein